MGLPPKIKQKDILKPKRKKTLKANNFMGTGSTTRYDSERKKQASLCIFASYHKGLYVDEFIYYYLNHLLECNFDIVFVSNSEISDFDLNKLNKICKRIIQKENIGLDFSAYKTGLLTENYGLNYDFTLLTNVSIYGPLFPLK